MAWVAQQPKKPKIGLYIPKLIVLIAVYSHTPHGAYVECKRNFYATSIHYIKTQTVVCLMQKKRWEDSVEFSIGDDTTPQSPKGFEKQFLRSHSQWRIWIEMFCCVWRQLLFQRIHCINSKFYASMCGSVLCTSMWRKQQQQPHRLLRWNWKWKKMKKKKLVHSVSGANAKERCLINCYICWPADARRECRVDWQHCDKITNRIHGESVFSDYAHRSMCWRRWLRAPIDK